MIRFGEERPQFMEESTWAANKAPHPRQGIESEVLLLQAMKQAGVQLVPKAYLPNKEAVLVAGEYCCPSTAFSRE